MDIIENSIIDLHRGLENKFVSPTPDLLREELNKVLGKGPKVQKVTLMEFIETVIGDSTEGSRLTKNGKRFRLVTIKGYRTTLNHLLNYQKEKGPKD